MKIAQKIITLETVHSTNNYLISLLEKDKNTLEEGTVLITSEQTAGRGTGNNTWESERGKNLTFSLLLYPAFLRPENQFQLSKAIALGVADYVELVVGKAKVKWTNDIYVDDKKIAGILIENSISGSRMTSSVVGIGLNINQTKFYSNAPNPVSLAQITGCEYHLEDELIKLCNCLQKRYLQLQKTTLNSALNHDYLAHLYRFGDFHIYAADNKRFTAKIVGVDKIGRLILENQQAERQHFAFKEVVFVI